MRPGCQLRRYADRAWRPHGHLVVDAVARGPGVGLPVGSSWPATLIVARLRSIHIPNGDFRRSQADLYVKMNLKRFGCGGRSSLTIDTPR